MTQIKILVAEDDKHIRMGIVDTLESEGYHAVEAQDGEQAMKLFADQTFDMVLLDIMMPEKNGYDVCRDIRAKDQKIPIILLTAKSEEIDKVVGLKLGADDYITKPFGVHEFLARIAALFRRTGQSGNYSEDTEKTVFSFGPYQVNAKTFKLAGQGRDLDLSRRELAIICLFHDHPGEVLSRDTILNAVWGIDYLGTTRTLDQHIAQLRKKIEPDPSCPRLITTVHGVGYRYEAGQI